MLGGGTCLRRFLRTGDDEDHGAATERRTEPSGCCRRKSPPTVRRCLQRQDHRHPPLDLQEVLRASPSRPRRATTFGTIIALDFEAKSSRRCGRQARDEDQQLGEGSTALLLHALTMPNTANADLRPALHTVGERCGGAVREPLGAETGNDPEDLRVSKARGELRGGRRPCRHGGHEAVEAGRRCHQGRGVRLLRSSTLGPRPVESSECR